MKAERVRPAAPPLCQRRGSSVSALQFRSVESAAATRSAPWRVLHPTAKDSRLRAVGVIFPPEGFGSGPAVIGFALGDARREIRGPSRG